ncbi:hypothetical protein [Vibrio sonorensis]|uniref:hypothetical protein n=1 Tax=Vibrio sonorensis TaxID=1004316 RepID=UPI0008DAABCE|nr:hypothetical protein [Vibrio sonorensis]
MNGTRNYLYHVYVILFSFLVAACNGGDGGEGSSPNNPTTSAKTGSLQIVLQDETNTSQFESASIAVKSAVKSGKSEISAMSTPYSAQSTAMSPQNNTSNEPSLDLNADRFRVIGEGPANNTFDETFTGRGSRTLTGVAVGAWKVTVIAIDANGVEFARGVQNLTVRPTETTQSVVEVKMDQGNGGLSFQANWPKDIALTHNPKLELRDSKGNLVAGILINTVDSPTDPTMKQSSVEVGNTIPSGYYTLVFTVHDSNNKGENVHLATGFAETIRIIKDQSTRIEQTLKGVRGLGAIDLGVVLNLNNKLPISITNASSLPTSFAYDQPISFTLQADVPDTDSAFNAITKFWYVNGHFVEIAPTLTINSAISLLPTSYHGRYVSGHYRVDVVGYTTTGERSGSASFEFEVTGQQTKWLTQGTLEGNLYSGDSNGPVNLNNIKTLALKDSFGVEVQNAIQYDQATKRIYGAAIEEGEYVLTIEGKPSMGYQYIPYSMPVTIEAGRNANLGTIRLYEAYELPIDASTGGQLNVGDEKTSDIAKIKFPANAFVNSKTKAVYSGEVSVYPKAFNPSSESYTNAFPGGFTGIVRENGTDTEFDIISYGIVAASLVDNKGDKLELAPGKKATISIKVANPATAPATMPLWHLDEETGRWMQEGEATLVGDYYVGEVAHFSWWNFDYPCGSSDNVWGSTCPWIRVNFTVVDPEGNPSPFAKIKLLGEGNFAYSKTVTTDHTGRIKTKLPFSPSAVASQKAQISYEVQAEESVYSADGRKPGVSDKASMTFALTHTEGVAGYGTYYHRKLVLGEPNQPRLVVKAKDNDTRRIVNRTKAPVKFKKPSGSQTSSRVVFTVSNEGSAQLDFSGDDLGNLVIATNDDPENPTPAGNQWNAAPGLTSLESKGTKQSLNVTYTGSAYGTEKAYLHIPNNTNKGTLVIPLVTLKAGDDFQLVTNSAGTSQLFDGMIWWEQNPYASNPYVADPYAVDPYVWKVHSGSWQERRHYLRGNKRGYFAIDLSHLPDDMLVTNTKLTWDSYGISAYGGAVKLYKGKQQETITVDNAADGYSSACIEGDSHCVIAVVPATSGSRGEATLQL